MNAQPDKTTALPTPFALTPRIRTFVRAQRHISTSQRIPSTSLDAAAYNVMLLSLHSSSLLRRFSGINECAESRHDCSPNADCQDTPDSYKCRCRDDFVDESPDPSNRPGRVCRPALVDECRLRKHDCHKDAECHDLPQGFGCQCKAGFLDESPNRVTHPGRLCVPRPTPPPEECRIDDQRSCKGHLNEVCRLVPSRHD